MAPKIRLFVWLLIVVVGKNPSSDALLVSQDDKESPAEEENHNKHRIFVYIHLRVANERESLLERYSRVRENSTYLTRKREREKRRRSFRCFLHVVCCCSASSSR